MSEKETVTEGKDMSNEQGEATVVTEVQGVSRGGQQEPTFNQMAKSFFVGFAEAMKHKDKKKKKKGVICEGESEDDDEEEDEINHASELMELGLQSTRIDPFAKHLINTQRRIIFGVGQKRVVLGVYSLEFLMWLKQGSERFEGKFEFLKERYLACCQCPLLGDAILRVGELIKNMDAPGPLGAAETEKKYVRIALCELLALYLGRRLEKEGEVPLLFARLSCPVMDLSSMTKTQIMDLKSESLACLWLMRKGGDGNEKHKKPRVEQWGGIQAHLRC